MSVDEIKKKIITILKKYNVKKAGIFGSFVRGENT
jgi:predicted nucleotidyltransferase